MVGGLQVAVFADGGYVVHDITTDEPSHHALFSQSGAHKSVPFDHKTVSTPQPQLYSSAPLLPLIVSLPLHPQIISFAFHPFIISSPSDHTITAPPFAAGIVPPYTVRLLDHQIIYLLPLMVELI